MSLLFSLPLGISDIEVDKKLTKLYYSIGEVSEMFSVNTSLIRFWEKEFGAIKPKKNKKGNRLFTQKDIENLRLIYRLVKVEGYTLEGAKQQLKQGGKVKGKGQEKKEAVLLLTKIKMELKNLKELL